MVLKRRGGRSRSRIAALAAASVLVAGPVLAGCGSDDGDSAAPATETAATEPDDPAAARAEITENWTTFFDPDTPVAERAELLENGEQMRPALEALLGNQAASAATAKVKGIEFTSPNDANVTYDLLVSGAPAVPDSRGTSVFQEDTWKVSLKTLCGLAQLSGATVPGC
ncbi:hypothetical protein M5362_29900 [Streptomyces sp. Je 1-79]|uniref:hypothetical protein n=1 Tax=Streptomyces sp. Je 1-79 TaxID=2943847 RepID=UPI0021A6068E|nr:hypothetical protein [Streptomyces sp. Je 1-79]MCT4357319.1 hypothetical protein [Streptomyces sp. Je 1-79]